MRDLRAIVLAAGMGKRLGSETTGIPKVMRTANGKPLLKYVLDALSPKPEDTIIVVGYKKETVMEAFSEYQFAVQERQLGTGDAVKAAEPNIDDDFEGSVLVCYGDMPLFKRETYDTLVEVHNAERNIVTILTGIYPEQMPFGRIIRDSGGGFERIVEAKDSDAEIDKIREYNAGIYVFEKAALFDTLGRITTNNAQGEYYLTDAPEIIRTAGGKVGLCSLPLGDQMVGVSTEEDLKLVERILNNA